MTTMNFKNSVLLAPLTKGGNLPFRRLCADFGAEITVSEMAYARFIVKGENRERALLRRHASEKIFGVQLAAKDPAEGAQAAKIALDYGCDFIDLNCGCPIEDTTRRGLGASLLKRTRTVENLVSGMVKELGMAVPLTVKIRLGWKESEKNFIQVAQAAQSAGAAAVIVHGRTREQRYSRAADWEAIKAVKEALHIPVIGNGDILTYFEATAKKNFAAVDGIMLARGALIKPWLFQEIRENRTIDFSAVDRLLIYFRFTQYLKDHFRDDEKGRARIMQFLPWHFSFFHRYQYLPASEFETAAATHPLMQSRLMDKNSDAIDPLEKLLRHPHPEVHQLIALLLLNANEATVVDAARILADKVSSDFTDRQHSSSDREEYVSNG